MPAATAGDRWVCLDVGETLIDETRIWMTWASVLDVTPLTMMAALGVAIAGGEHRDVFALLGRPDWHELAPQVEELYGGFRDGDLYPDALTALPALTGLGYRVAVLANQPGARTAELHALGVAAELMAMSEELGVHKPDPAFFRRALELMGGPDPADVAYVGDRLDNDVRPAAAAGMRAVWLRRGPWAALSGERPAEAALVVDSLAELVERIGEALPMPAAAGR
ncbi:MAG: HAD family hydrolase [Chloroflexota bacterium]|nr:HAD family hydrolase [Chloroflexota bacterium]